VIPTEHFLPIYQRGRTCPMEIPCDLPHWTGGQQHDAMYTPDGAHVRLVHRNWGRTMTEHRITRHELRFDAHSYAATGTEPTPARLPLWLCAVALVGAGLVLWSLLVFIVFAIGEALEWVR